MVIYFSGTGNSRHLAIRLAGALRDTFTNSAHYIRTGETYEDTTDSPLVFVCPTYASYIPKALENFIRQGKFVPHKPCYFVMTCGISNDQIGSTILLKRLCDEKGLVFMGVRKIIMPENYITLFMAPPQFLAEKIIRSGEKKMDKIAETIQKGEKIARTEPFGFVVKASNPFFYKVLTNDKKFFVKKSCTGCGKCERVCPLANIKMQNGQPTWNGNCTQCQACICTCPQKAIEYGLRSRGKRRYYLEETGKKL